MITQIEVDQLQADLERLRTTLARDRVVSHGELNRLIDKADDLRSEALGTNYEPSIRVVHDLLVSLSRGVRARYTLNAAGEPRGAA